MNEQRTSKRRIEELAQRLGPRDKQIIKTLERCRYLTTDQIRRLYFTDHATPVAALKAANRNLSKLREFGLIESLKRRIGGVRAGSGSYVWTLSETGSRLRNLGNESPRKRSFEPSPAFLEHTLALSETYLQFIEICRRNDLELVRSELEPACWRQHVGIDGKSAYLKPDMFAITASGNYEDCWFIELDLATESISVVLEKCMKYAHYCLSGMEQKETGVFPLVVWIVPSLSRKRNLKRAIAESHNLQLKDAFAVITPDELESLLTQGLVGLESEVEGNVQPGKA